jgi:anti-sigma B factor antagonist
MTWFSSSPPDPPVPPDPATGRSAGPWKAPIVVEVEVSQDTATVMITGELDLTTRPVLAKRLSLVLRTKPRRLVLDMAGAGFLDCGTARLIASAGRLLPDGSRLIIRHPSPSVRRVLELTGFDAECEIEG